MAIKTFDMQELEDGSWLVRDPGTGRILIAGGRVQDGLWEQEAREANDLHSDIRFDHLPGLGETKIPRAH